MAIHITATNVPAITRIASAVKMSGKLPSWAIKMIPMHTFSIQPPISNLDFGRVSWNDKLHPVLTSREG